MKIALLATILLACPVWAANSPYEILKDKFYVGAKTQLTELPTIEECIAGKKRLLTLSRAVDFGTTLADLRPKKTGFSFSPLYVVRIPNLKWMKKAATPASGPLFPPTAEEVVTLPMVIAEYPCAAAKEEQPDVYRDQYFIGFYGRQNYVLTDSRISLFAQSSHERSASRVVFRTIEGSIIGEDTITEGEYSVRKVYHYFWPE